MPAYLLHTQKEQIQEMPSLWSHQERLTSHYPLLARITWLYVPCSEQLGPLRLHMLCKQAH